MYLFNCSQRAHGNYMEQHPSTALAMLIAGVDYPLVASGLGVVWILGRIVYAIGYTNPSGTRGEARSRGGRPAFLSQLVLFGLASWVGIRRVISS
jgi:glutathione S-transferase